MNVIKSVTGTWAGTPEMAVQKIVQEIETQTPDAKKYNSVLPVKKVEILLSYIKQLENDVEYRTRELQDAAGKLREMEERLRTKECPWPEDIFTPLTDEELREITDAISKCDIGGTPDRFSAHLMRIGWKIACLNFPPSHDAQS